MNYIGSKFSLLQDIERVLDANEIRSSGKALDIFAGTGTVAQLLKKRGYITYANDWQYYSYIVCTALLKHNELPSFDRLLSANSWRQTRLWSAAAADVLDYLSALPGKRGAFYDAYCEGGDAGRQYYAKENGLRIQAIRDQIESWSHSQMVSPEEKAWLVACLLEAADKVANTASVYGAYLKHIKRSAQKPLHLRPLTPTPSCHPASVHQTFCSDAEQLLRALAGTRFELVYVDPPYNSRQYNANYHLLETIARWDLDKFEPRGLTGLRNAKENRSRYCLKSKVLEGFRRLLALMNTEYVLFSYNDEGLASREDLEDLFSSTCMSVKFEEIPYKRFRADMDHENRIYKGNTTVEYLILGHMRSPGEALQSAPQAVECPLAAIRS